ncbi:MAG: hypothetical protein ACP5RW_01185 [bacterium]
MRRIILTSVVILILVLSGLPVFAQGNWEFGMSKVLNEDRYFIDARLDYESFHLALGNLYSEGDSLIIKPDARGVFFSMTDENMNSYNIVIGSLPSYDLFGTEFRLAYEGYNDTVGLYKASNSWGLAFKRDGTELLGPILGSYDYRSYLTFNSGNFGFATYSTLGFASGAQAINLDIGYISSTSDFFLYPANSLPFGIGIKGRVSSGVIVSGNFVPYVCFNDGSWGINLDGSLSMERLNVDLGINYYKNLLLPVGKVVFNLSDTDSIIMRFTPSTIGIGYGSSF